MAKRPLYRLPAGSELVLDGRRWRVVGRDSAGYAVEGIDDGECYTLSIERVDSAIDAGDARAITPKMAEQRKKLLTFTGGIEYLDQLPEDERRDVRARLGLVLAMDDLEASGAKLTQRYLDRRDVRERLRCTACELSKDDKLFHGVYIGSQRRPHSLPKGRTLHEMRATYHEYDRNPVVLMRRNHMKGPQGEARRKTTDPQERFIDYVLNRYYETVQPKLAKVYRAAKAIWATSQDHFLKGFQAPSLTTVRNRLKAINDIAKSAGRDGLRYAQNRYGAGRTDVRALDYGDHLVTDQVLLSIFVNDKGKEEARVLDPAKADEKLAPNEKRRLWLHVMRDVATRLVVAWVLAESPDADHQKTLLRMATRDKTRLAQRYECKRKPAPPVGLGTVKSDNGSATRNTAIYESQLGLGATVITGRTYNSTDNAFAEAVFGPLQWDVLNMLAGYVGSRPGELNGYDGHKEAGLTRDTLMGTITRYFVDEVPFGSSRGTGMFGATPWQRLEETIETYGGIKPPDPVARRIHLGEASVVSTTSEGVKVFGIPYNSSDLQQFAGGASKRVTVFLDPDDLREVTIISDETKDIITADLTMTIFADLTLEEAVEVMRQAVEANPEKRQLHEEYLQEAIARRARESGFFPEPADPAGYVRIDELRRQAAQMANVEFVPMPRSGPTVSPGNVMAPPAPAISTTSAEKHEQLEESVVTEVHQPSAKFKADTSPPAVSVPQKPPQTSLPMFTPITRSKL